MMVSRAPVRRPVISIYGEKAGKRVERLLLPQLEAAPAAGPPAVLPPSVLRRGSLWTAEAPGTGFVAAAKAARGPGIRP